MHFIDVLTNFSQTSQIACGGFQKHQSIYLIKNFYIVHSSSTIEKPKRSYAFRKRMNKIFITFELLSSVWYKTWLPYFSYQHIQDHWVIEIAVEPLDAGFFFSTVVSTAHFWRHACSYKAKIWSKNRFDRSAVDVVFRKRQKIRSCITYCELNLGILTFLIFLHVVDILFFYLRFYIRSLTNFRIHRSHTDCFLQFHSTMRIGRLPYSYL